MTRAGIAMVRFSAKASATNRSRRSISTSSSVRKHAALASRGTSHAKYVMHSDFWHRKSLKRVSCIDVSLNSSRLMAAWPFGKEGNIEP